MGLEFIGCYGIVFSQVFSLWRGMRYKVPQNIDMQDRILGPLTMVQFLYAVVGFGLCYAIYSAIPKPFSYILDLPLALMTTALVFLKINERPFLDFLISVMEFTTAPKQRVWHHENLPDLKVEIYQSVKQKSNTQNNTKVYTREEISQLAQQLDNPNYFKKN